jgi:hypothetical protein
VDQHSSRRRFRRLLVPLTAATLLTGSVVGVAVVTGGGASSDQTEQAARPAPLTVTLQDSPYELDRTSSFSRSAKRVTLKKKPEVRDHEFRTAALNLWPAPKATGKPLAVLKKGGQVAMTGVRKNGFAQILHDGKLRWVKDAYLSDQKPKPEVTAARSGAAASGGGLSSAPCADGSGTESGLTSSAVTLFRSACAAFPALSSYGGYDGHGEHSSGRAIDFMVTDPALGQALADWARAHASELNLYDIIWSQRIWTPVRSSEGWRSMPDRGSPTANHYDHVHISVN